MPLFSQSNKTKQKKKKKSTTIGTKQCLGEAAKLHDSQTTAAIIQDDVGQDDAGSGSWQMIRTSHSLQMRSKGSQKV